MDKTKTTRTELIAVTGAGGFIGSQIVPHLKENGFPVRPISGLRSTNLVLPDQLDELLKDVHTVVHCAGSPTGPSFSDRQATVTFQCSAESLNASLINSCKRQGVKRLIFLSSSKVYLPSDEMDVYAFTKYLTELQIDEYSGDQLETLCLRIPMVYGPKPKANFALMSKLSKVRYLPLPLGSIQNKQSFLSITNLSRSITRLIEAPKWDYTTLDIADPKPHSTPEILQFLAEANGNSKLTFIPFPVSILEKLSVLAGKYHLFRSFSRNLTVKSYPTDMESAFPEIELLSTHEAIQQYFGKESL